MMNLKEQLLAFCGNSQSTGSTYNALHQCTRLRDRENIVVRCQDQILIREQNVSDDA